MAAGQNDFLWHHGSVSLVLNVLLYLTSTLCNGWLTLPGQHPPLLMNPQLQSLLWLGSDFLLLYLFPCCRARAILYMKKAYVPRRQPAEGAEIFTGSGKTCSELEIA